MRKIILLTFIIVNIFLVLMACASSPNHAFEIDFDINSYCRKIAAGGSYQIEKTCREMEHRARGNLSRMTIPPRIEKYCRGIAGGSYIIMETCVTMELKAKENLYPQ